MTEQEKQQRTFQIYAALGELSVRLKKQHQIIKSLRTQESHFEEELVNLLNTPTKKPSENTNDNSSSN